MRLYPKALLLFMAFWAMLLLGLDVRLGTVAIIAAAVIDWLFLAAPLIPDGGRHRPPE
jgi:hypothetical protein